MPPQRCPLVLQQISGPRGKWQKRVPVFPLAFQIEHPEALPDFGIQSEQKANDAEREEEEEDVVFALTDFSQRPTMESTDHGPQLQTAELLQQQKQVLHHLYILPWEWKL